MPSNLIPYGNIDISILKPPVKYLTEEEKDRLKSAVDKWAHESKLKKHKKNIPFISARDKLFIEFVWNTGMRVSDALNIKFRDIDQYKEQISFLVKKRSKTKPFYHTISLDKSILFEVQRFKEMFFFKPEHLIFDITRQTMDANINRYGYLAGFPLREKMVKVRKDSDETRMTYSYCNVHMLRHGRAMKDLTEGIPDFITAFRLGHSNTTITNAIYRRVNVEVERTFRKKTYG